MNSQPVANKVCKVSVGEFVVSVLGYDSLGAYFSQALGKDKPEEAAGKLMQDLIERYTSYAVTKALTDDNSK